MKIETNSMQKMEIKYVKKKTMEQDTQWTNPIYKGKDSYCWRAAAYSSYPVMKKKEWNYDKK